MLREAGPRQIGRVTSARRHRFGGFACGQSRG